MWFGLQSFLCSMMKTQIASLNSNTEYEPLNIIISKRKADGERCRLFGMPGAIRTRDLSLRSSSRGAFSTPFKSPKILDFTGVSGVSLLLNSRPKPANFSWFFAFLLAGYYRRFLHNRNTAVMLSTSKLTQRTSRTRKDFRIPKRIGRYSRMLTNR